MTKNEVHKILLKISLLDINLNFVTLIKKKISFHLKLFNYNKHLHCSFVK